MLFISDFEKLKLKLKKKQLQVKVINHTEFNNQN